MRHSGSSVVERARALVGTRFRPKGRSRASGLDCVGLASAATGIARVPEGYALRGGSAVRIASELRTAGFRRYGTPEPGDVLVLQTGPEQLHLGVWTGGGLVHADAGLRRVVERPGIPPWPIIGIWRRIIAEA
jgi:hypothetical protein